MDVDAVAQLVERLWGLPGSEAETVVDGPPTTIRFPSAGVAVHVSRALPSSARVQAAQNARARLADADIPVVTLLPTITGAYWQPWQDRYVEVENWVDHEGRMNLGAPSCRRRGDGGRSRRLG